MDVLLGGHHAFHATVQTEANGRFQRIFFELPRLACALSQKTIKLAWCVFTDLAQGLKHLRMGRGTFRLL